MGNLKNKSKVTKKLCEICRLSDNCVFTVDSSSEDEGFFKLLTRQDVEINDIIPIYYKDGNVMRKAITKPITISVKHIGDSNVAYNMVRVIVIYDGFFEAHFNNDEWEVVTRNLNIIAGMDKDN